MSDPERPSRAKQLAAALARARGESPSAVPVRRSSIPPATDRKSVPKREGRRLDAAARQSLFGDGRGHSNAPSNDGGRSRYMPEVRRSLLPDQPSDVRPDLSLSMPPAPHTDPTARFNVPSPRVSITPAPPRFSAPPVSMRPRSGPPAGFDEPGTGRRSLLPGADHDPRGEDDPRFREAADLRWHGQKLEAMELLEALLQAQPGHAPARLELFSIAMEVRDEGRVRQLHDWLVQYYVHHQQPSTACQAYRAVRLAFPNLSFKERTLIAALLSAEQAREGRVVVDTTKLLLKDFPQSSTLPRAFMSSAQVQLDEGRPDLAKRTLENLLARFPHDSLAQEARRKLRELG